MSILTGSEQRLEILNQVLSENQKLMQRWDERLHLGNLKIATRWLAGTVVFACKIAREDSEKVNWLICYCPSESRPREWYPAEKILGRQNEELTVFVNDVQVVNHPQRLISAFVRPEFINGILGIGGHTCYFSRLDGFVIMQRPS